MRGARSIRVAEQMRRELADLLRMELKDPRVTGMVSVTEVVVSPDLAHAKVFFTVLGSEAEPGQTGDALQRAAGFLRTELGRRMSLRTVPKLAFEFDESIARGARLSQLIDSATRADPRVGGGTED